MVASSLANWDGSLSPAKSPSAPLSSQTGTLMNGTLVNSSSAHALPARISHPSSEQGTSRHSQVTPDTKATYPSPVASSPMPESSLGPVSPRVVRPQNTYTRPSSYGATQPSKTTYSSPVASSSMPESSLGHASPRVTSQTTYESPVASSSMSVSPPAPTSLSPLQKQQTSPSPAPAHLVRTSVPHPPPPLPFGPPRDILTTPTSSSASGPPWLNHSPSPKDGLISLDIQATSLANYKAGRTAPVQRAHTIPSSATHAPPVSVLSSAHSLPSLLGGRTSTIANALAPSASFGRPGPALGASASGARAPPVFGPGAALTSPAAGQATQDSTSAMGKSPTSAPQPASIPPKRSPGASESPLSSLSASPASSPAARGAWWGNGYVVGSVYVDAGTVNLVPQVVTDWSKAKAGSKTSGGKMSDAAGTKDRHRKDEEGGESLGAEARVRSAVTVTYESKAKAKAREQEVAERGRSAASSQSVYESGHGRSVSASGSGTIHQGSKSQLFIASPEISKAPTPHQLFTPSPGRLFTPTPERSVSPVRRHVPPGVGIARKVSKRKREVMDYVLVPPMPYKRARTDHMDKQRGAGATARTGRRESRRAESWETRGTSRGRGTGRRMERSASTHGERRWESENSRSRSRSRSPRPRKIRAPSRVARETHDSVGDALNYAWNHNAGSGTIPVGGAAGRGTVRVRRKRDRAREENWEDDDKGTRKRVKSDLPSDGQSSREDEVPESKQAFRWRKFAWCREEADKIFMHFDLPVEMADRAAYAALRLPDGAKTIALARPCDRPVPCLVPPVLQQEQDADGLWAGGVILGDGGSESKEDRRYRAPKVKEGLGEVSRGRTTQREEQLLESKIVTKPKTKPTPRALAGPSKVHVRAVTPISSLAPVRTLSLLPSSSPSTFYRPPLENVPPVSLATSPDLLASPSTLLWTDAPLPAPPPSRAVDTPKEAPPPLSMSVKAKGKQKMQSPSTNIVRTPSPRGDKGASQWAPRRSASRSHRSASRGRRSKSRGRSLALRPMAEPSMSAYFHGLDPSPPGLQSSPRGLRFSPAAPLTTPVFALSAQFDYAPDETHLQLANAGPSFYLPPENHQYGDGTIDPSLLGGGVMDLDGGDYYDQAQETYSPTHSVVSLPSPGPSISPLGLRLSSRRPVQRRIPDDMMPTDIYESTISSASSSADFNDIAFVPPSPKSKPKNAKPRRQGKGGQTKVNASAITSVPSADRFFRYSGPPWPPGDPDAFCHQCRRKTKYMTMKYDECQHIYCVRCVMLKYEPNTVAFEVDPPTVDCPRCSDICSCDACCNRRGQVYVRCRPKAGRPPTAPLERRPRHVTHVAPRTEASRDTSLDQMVINPGKYYATIYDLSGARVAEAYTNADADADADDDNQVVLARRVEPSHMFIGAIREGWKLGADPIIYVEPTPILPSKQRTHGKVHFYIGNESVLSLPIRPRPPPPPAPPPVPSSDLELATVSRETGMNLATDFDAPLSPLSSLGDTATAQTGEIDGPVQKDPHNDRDAEYGDEACLDMVSPPACPTAAELALTQSELAIERLNTSN